MKQVPDIYDVVEAISANIDYVREKFKEYEEVRRMINPRILIVGPGRCGKDTACEYLSKKLVYKFGGSTSWSVAPIMACLLWQTGGNQTPEGQPNVPWRDLSDSEKKNLTDYYYSKRHEHRKYWYDYCNMLRRIDPFLLLKLTIGQSWILAGTRSYEELDNAIKLFDPQLVVWPDRDVPEDPTLEFTFGDVCNYKTPERSIIMVDNAGDLESFQNNLDQLMIGLGYYG